MQHWPSRLWIVRHGESAGNVARDAAMQAGAARIDIDARDVDVPLSALGEQQADAVGRWFNALPEAERPEVVVASPYARAQRSAALIRNAGGLTRDAAPDMIDERLREKEFGILDRLTSTGIKELYPDEAERRQVLGKFYYRPPAGESWCDVILRLRSALHTMSIHYEGRRVLIVGHQVVVLCLRYLIENLSEQKILAIDAQGDVANCSVTEYAFDTVHAADRGPVLKRYNFVAPVEQSGARVTSEPDENRGASR